MSYQAIVETDAKKFPCLGDGGSLGHPKIYLEIDDALGEVVCPYCAKIFILKNGTN